MHLKFFTAVPQPVPDPMRPNRTVNVTRLRDACASSHVDENGVTYKPDENGWFDFPQDVADRLRRFRNKGSGWFAEGEIADAVRLGRAERDTDDRPRRQDSSSKRPPAGRPRKEDG